MKMHLRDQKGEEVPSVEGKVQGVFINDIQGKTTIVLERNEGYQCNGIIDGLRPGENIKLYVPNLKLDSYHQVVALELFRDNGEVFTRRLLKNPISDTYYHFISLA